MRKRKVVQLRHQFIVDLGTDGLRVAVAKGNMLIVQPTCVAIDQFSRIVAVGEEALSFVNKTPRTITTLRPVKDSIIADYAACEALMQRIFEDIHKTQRVIVRRPDVVFIMPPGLSTVERRTAAETVFSTGARRAFFTDQMVAGAVGSGNTVTRNTARVIVDIGAGTTKVSAVSRGRVYISKSQPIAGNDVTELIQQTIRDDIGLQVAFSAAERLKREVVSVYGGRQSWKKLWIEGKDTLTGLPKRQRVGTEQLVDPVVRHLRGLVDFLRNTFDDSSEAFQSQVKKNGVCLIGGGSQLRGLEELLSNELKIPFSVAPNAETAVIEGATRMWQEPDIYRSYLQRAHTKQGFIA